MSKICGIYKITSPTSKIYIGQSVDIKRRIARYKCLDCKHQYKLYNSILKYGWDSHAFEIITECDRNTLNELEIFYIDYYETFNTKHGMNLTNGGDSKRMVSEETKLKISLGNKGKCCRKASTETIQKLKDSHMNIKPSDETRKKIGEKAMNNKSKTGQKLSLETIEKLKVFRRKFRHSEKSKSKMSVDRKLLNTKKHNTYEIYNQNNELIFKFKGVFDIEMKFLNLPSTSFRKTYLNNCKIKIGKYKNWYAVKILCQ